MKPAPVMMTTAQGLRALSPVGVFMLFYLVVSLVQGDFYAMPISVALLAASAWAAFLLRGKSLNDRLEVFSREAGSVNMMYMVWIFILAGAFAALAKGTGSVEATVNLALRYLPHQFIAPGMFLAGCFISLSIGSSVGTVVALTPLAVEMSRGDESSVAFLVAVVLGGAFFGDNLSFISDTTIAATRTQGCSMKDKFRANFRIVLPAALITLAVYFVMGAKVPHAVEIGATDPLLVIPYITVIITAIAGVNVTLVLGIGIIAAIAIGILRGMDILALVGFMGTGIASMGELTIITLLAGGMLGLIKALGGIDYLIQLFTRWIRGKRGAGAGIVAMVGLVDLCTANNTVAILTVGELARRIGNHFGIEPKRCASLLDTGSCIVQALIPYGAQALMAAGLAGIAPGEPWPYLYYPWALTLTLSLAIILPPRRAAKKAAGKQ